MSDSRQGTEPPINTTPETDSDTQATGEIMREIVTGGLVHSPTNKPQRSPYALLTAGEG